MHKFLLGDYRLSDRAADMRAIMADDIPPTIPPQNGAGGPTAARAYVPFCQRNDAWAAQRLGGTNLTIGGYGCALTCVAMIAAAADPNGGINPGTLNVRLARVGAYTADGLLKWGGVGAACRRIGYMGGQTWRQSPADMQLVWRWLSGGPVILQVDFKPDTSPLDTHFVLAVAIAGRDIRIIDPWRGDECGLLERYARPDWALSRAIYAARVIRPTMLADSV